jgi:hypothetical protein
MRAWKRLLLASILMVAFVAGLAADVRKDNIDVIIALDKSLSMEHKIGAVETWVNSYIIDQLLIPGDYLIVVTFYGQADVSISQQVTDDASKQSVKNIISQVKGDGRFTDIGNALDVLKAQIASRETDGREKYVLLLTDGIQEAPPTSKYYSKDGSFNHEFLTNTKTIQEMGWKVMILGIGTDTAAKDLAKELQGSYGEISESPTVESLTQQTGGLFGAIEVQGGMTVSPFAADGASRIAFSLKPSGLQGDASITVSDVTAIIGGRAVTGILASPFTIDVKKDATTRVAIPVAFPADMPQGIGVLSFTFASAQIFTPTDVAVTFAVKTWVQSNLVLVIGGAVLLLLIIAAALFLLWRFTKGRPVRFAVVIDDTHVTEEPVSLRTGRELFLMEKDGEFTLAAKRTGKAIARFSVKDGAVVLGVLKQDRFPKLKDPKDVPADARGKSFVLRSERGKNLTMKVQSKERKK